MPRGGLEFHALQNSTVPKQKREKTLVLALLLGFFSCSCSRAFPLSALTRKRNLKSHGQPMHCASPITSPSTPLLVFSIKSSRRTREAHSEREARVLALAAAGGAVANVLLRCPVERPDDGGDDDEGPALGSGDAEDLARAFSAEAVVDLKKKTLEFEEREREEREREERKL